MIKAGTPPDGAAVRPSVRFSCGVGRAAIVILSLAGPLPALAQTPFVPDEWRFGRREDDSRLRYCVDPRDPEFAVSQAIGEAVAGALLLEPQPYVVEDPSVTADFEVLYRQFLEHCDLYFGFKLIPGAYPDWLMLSRPYYEASYVVVVADPDWAALADMPASQPIGSAIGTAADLRLIQYLQAVDADERWPRFPMASNEAALTALMEGSVGAALVWAPALWAMQQDSPAAAELRVVASDPLPVSTAGVGAAMRSDDTFLRSSIDQAIAALSADGTIQAILDEHAFPAAVVP